MKRYFWGLIYIFCLIVAQSCAPTKLNKVYIKDHNEKMECVKLHFPQIYNLYISGDVIIYDVYEYIDAKTGSSKVNVSYRYR